MFEWGRNSPFHPSPKKSLPEKNQPPKKSPAKKIRSKKSLDNLTHICYKCDWTEQGAKNGFQMDIKHTMHMRRGAE